MEKKKLYEVECHRTNVLPRQFWNYCCQQFEKKTGRKFDWIDDYYDWKEPAMESDIKSKHEDWDKPMMEICKIKPYEFHQYLEGNYNFIMEWCDDIGYMYVVEFER